MKEFAVLLVAPKDWAGDCVGLECTAWRSGYQETAFRKVMTVALYMSDDTQARRRLEQQARGTPDLVYSTPVVTVAPAVPSPRPPAPEAAPDRPSTKSCSGSYKYEGNLATYYYKLGADGRWEGRTEFGAAGYAAGLYLGAVSHKTIYLRGDWSVKDGRLKITQIEQRTPDSKVWTKILLVVPDFDEPIKEFNKDLRILRLESGKELRPE
jgi:hypothetical protein